MRALGAPPPGKETKEQKSFQNQREGALGFAHVIYSRLTIGLRWAMQISNGLGLLTEASLLRGLPLLMDSQRQTFCHCLLNGLGVSEIDYRFWETQKFIVHLFK